MTRDMTRPNWARTAARFRRLADQLRAQGFRVIEPEDFDTPPGERLPYTPSEFRRPRL